MRRFALFFVIFGLASAIIMSVGVFFVAMGCLEAWRGRASVSWPTVAGEVLDARVVESRRRSGTGRGGSSSATESIPLVRYAYEVNGERHESQRVDFKTRAGGRAAALEELGDLAPGATVTVHYDPNDPSLAVLRPGNGPWDWIPPLVGMLGIVVPPTLFLIARHWIRIAERAERLAAKRSTRSAPSDPFPSAE